MDSPNAEKGEGGGGGRGQRGGWFFYLQVGIPHLATYEEQLLR